MFQLQNISLRRQSGLPNRSGTVPLHPQDSHLGDSLVRLGVAGGLKGGVADQTLVAEDPDTPQVHLLVVSVALDHLWGQVVQGPTHRPPPSGAQQKKSVWTSSVIRNRISHGLKLLLLSCTPVR